MGDVKHVEVQDKQSDDSHAQEERLLDPAPHDEGRMEGLLIWSGELCWMLKELGWVLLVPFFCYAAVPLILFMFAALLVSACHESGIVQMTTLGVMLIWCLTNCTWMTTEVWYHTPEVQTPWALTPVEDPNETIAQKVERSAAFGFGAGVALFVVVLLYLVIIGMHTEKYGGKAKLLLLESPEVFWCAKDIFWSQQHLAPALACDFAGLAVLTYTVMIGYTPVTLRECAWMCWVIGNVAWLLCELSFDYSLTWRYTAASFIGVAAVLHLMSFSQLRKKKQTVRDIEAYGAML